MLRILLLLSLAAPAFASPYTERLARYRSHTEWQFTVRSGSMKPAWRVGDVVVVWNLPYAAIVAGKPVVYYSHRHGTAIAHLAVHQWPDGSWLVKGTNWQTNSLPDYSAVTPANYIGIPVYLYKQGKVLTLLR